MPSYSRTSRRRLDTATAYLQNLFGFIVRFYDNTIIEGHRTQSRQDELYNATPPRTKVRWPNSKHNRSPSHAVDSAPWFPGRGIPWPRPPRDWNNAGERAAYIKALCQFYHYGGFVEGVAAGKGQPRRIRWGGDWDRDHDVTDQVFNDLVHFEDRGAFPGDTVA